MSGARSRPAPSASAQVAAAPGFAALQEAAEWFAELRSGDAAPDAARQWQAWLDAAPGHRDAWRKIEAVNAQFGMLPGEPARETLATGQWQRRDSVRKLVMLCLATAAGGAALLSRRDTRDSIAALGAQYQTAIGASRQIALADGSQLWLNTNSAADADFTPALRRIHLRSGEMLIQSAADTQVPPRSLVADVAHGRLRALGTRFSVRIDADTTHVAVYDGLVQVEPAGGQPPLRLAAGTQLRFHADWIGAPFAADASIAAWSQRRLVADQMRLDDFLAELGRYRRGHLACDPAVAHLRLIGSYPLDDTDRILAALEATLPVTVRRILPWWVSIEARATAA